MLHLEPAHLVLLQTFSSGAAASSLHNSAPFLVLVCVVLETARGTQTPKKWTGGRRRRAGRPPSIETSGYPKEARPLDVRRSGGFRRSGGLNFLHQRRFGGRRGIQGGRFGVRFAQNVLVEFSCDRGPRGRLGSGIVLPQSPSKARYAAGRVGTHPVALANGPQRTVRGHSSPGDCLARERLDQFGCGGLQCVNRGLFISGEGCRRSRGNEGRCTDGCAAPHGGYRERGNDHALERSERAREAGGKVGGHCGGARWVE